MFDLSQISLFSGLQGSDISVIASLLKKIDFPSDSLIIKEGEISSNLYIVESGTLNVYISNKNGSNFEIATIGANSYFGEYAFLDNAKRTASVVSASDVVLYEITKEDFTQILEQYPSVYTVMIQNLVRTIRKQNDLVKELRIKHIYPLLKEFLTIRSQSSGFGNRKSRGKLTPPIIAGQIDCDISTVAYLLSILEENKFIEIEGETVYLYKTLPEIIQ